MKVEVGGGVGGHIGCVVQGMGLGLVHASADQDSNKQRVCGLEFCYLQHTNEGCVCHTDCGGGGGGRR